LLIKAVAAAAASAATQVLRVMEDSSLTEQLIVKQEGNPKVGLLLKVEQPPSPRFVFTNGDYKSNQTSRHEEEDEEEVQARGKWFQEEMMKQLELAGPMILVNLLQYGMIFVSVMFVGHLGELSLASASIATSFAGVTGTALLMGMASTLETLCGQAYGAKQYHMLGIFLQRGILALVFISLPVTVIWYNIGELLIICGQDPEISAMAGEYARWLIPMLYALAISQPLIKFLLAQSVVIPMTMISILALVVHIPLCWLLIFKFGFGFRGAAITNGISSWLTVVFLALYVKFSPLCKKTWTGFSWDAFYDLKAFFKLAIPSTIMICLEYWSFEALVIMSGLLPNPQLETSTFSICLSTTALLYMVPFGISAAVSTRVSNELGAGCSGAARRAVKVAVSVSMVEGVLVASLLLILRHKLGWAFTNEAEVVNYVATCVPFLAVSTIMDSIQGVMGGVARGCGWQAFAAVANLGAYYIVGLPLAVVLAFIFHFNAPGLWAGIIAGMFTQAFSLSVLTIMTNWEKQAREALGRIYSSSSVILPLDGNLSQQQDIPFLLEKARDNDPAYLKS
jgi:MATE family multidrug resistance protein